MTYKIVNSRIFSLPLKKNTHGKDKFFTVNTLLINLLAIFSLWFRCNSLFIT